MHSAAQRTEIEVIGQKLAAVTSVCWCFQIKSGGFTHYVEERHQPITATQIIDFVLQTVEQ